MKKDTTVRLQTQTAFFKEMDYFVHKEAKSLGLSDSAYGILAAIGKAEGSLAQKELADACFLSKQTINSAIKSLEKRGLIELIKGKGGISMNEKGSQYYHEHILPFVELEKKVLEKMGEEAALFLSLSKRYTDLYKEHLEEVLI